MVDDAIVTSGQGQESLIPAQGVTARPVDAAPADGLRTDGQRTDVRPVDVGSVDVGPAGARLTDVPRTDSLSADGLPSAVGDGGTARQFARRRRTVFAVISAAVFMANLDLFVVNVAFPGIRADLGGDVAGLSWVLNAYAIVFAALIVPAGRLADRYGRRAGFLLGTAVFAVASAVCAVSVNVELLVAARVGQAAGAAVLVPTSLGLLLAATPPAQRARAVRAWTAVGGLAAALGPVIGGLLAELDWRWVFVINVPVGVAALVVGKRVLPESREAVGGRLPDLFGAVLLVVALGGLTLGFVEGPEHGWSSTVVVAAFVGAAIGLAGFAARSARHPSPVVEYGLLATPAFATALVVVLLFSVAFAAMLLSIVVFMGDVWGASALKTGLAVAPGPLLVPPFALRVAGQAGARFGANRVAAAGCAVFAGGVAWWAVSLDADPSYLKEILPGMLLTGAGVGLALPILVTAATSVLPPDRFATGSALVNMCRQVGSVVGVAMFVAILGTVAGVTELADRFALAWWAVAAVALVAASASLAIRPPARR
jgi:EmrB/QacA subfamily drug resistance transporter